MGVYVVTDDPDEEDEPSSSICCVGGCLTGCAFALLLLVILPAGALITFYAGNNNDYGILSVGICMIVIPILAVLMSIFIYMNRRRIRRFRKTKVNGTTKTLRGKTEKLAIDDVIIDIVNDDDIERHVSSGCDKENIHEYS